MVNNSANQTSPRTPLQGSPCPFDRRGARSGQHAARPPARFSSHSSQEPVNQKQEPSGNTLLAQRYPFPGNSYFWRTAGRGGFCGFEGSFLILIIILILLMPITIKIKIMIKIRIGAPRRPSWQREGVAGKVRRQFAI